MFSLFLSLAMLAASVGIFFGYIEGTYAHWQAVQEQYERVAETNRNYREYNEQFEKLLGQENALTKDTARLQKLLPDHVDMIRLILDLEAIADQHKNVSIGNFSFSQGQGTSESVGGSAAGAAPFEPMDAQAASTRTTGARYGTATITFTVKAPYEDGISFLRDIERSLRLLDITSLSLKPAQNPDDPFEFTVEAATYWLP